MSFVGMRRLARSGLALFATCLSGCLTLLGGGGQESITLPFEFEGNAPAWEVVRSDRNQIGSIDEFVRPGQTVENWTELVTTQAFNKAAGLKSVDDFMTAYRKRLVARCPGSTVEVVRRLPDGVLYESHVVNCPRGADGQLLARVLDGSWNRFIVQYAVRGALTLTPERRTEWTEKLMAVQIVDI